MSLTVDNPDINKIKLLLRKYSKRAFALRLVWGTSGNMSMRANANSFFITASVKSLGDISDKDLVFCRINKDTKNKNTSGD